MTFQSNKRAIWLLPLCAMITLSVGGVSGWLSSGEVRNWLPTLVKPAFDPPAWVFGPVWTLLYLLMGHALYTLWTRKEFLLRKRGLFVFWFQLALNFLWSLLFFNLRSIGWALVDILLLWASILYLILILKKVNSTAAFLQVPYLLWVSFASCLNMAYYLLNG